MNQKNLMIVGFVMNKAKYYKIMFIIAGIWNIFIALLFGILTPLIDSFLPFFGMNKPAIYFWIYGFFLLYGLFGFALVLVGLDITRNHLVVSSGMILKMLYFIYVLIFFILGDVNWVFLIIGGVELIFAGLFIEFYINYKKLDTFTIADAYSYKAD